MSSFSVFSGLKRTLSLFAPSTQENFSVGQDVTIKFLSAENLPKMDLIGSCDPYFIARIDGQLTYRSTILTDTLSPTWDDEEWIVKNIPINAVLTVTIYDKDDDSLSDDYIGCFTIENLSNYQSPIEGHPILNTSGRHQGHFHLTIEAKERSESDEKLPRYTFDGPCRYSRHDSPVFGLLAVSNANSGYATWKINLRRISVYFPPTDLQPWNRTYDVAKAIFSGAPQSIAKRNAMKLAHQMLYNRTIKNNQSGRINSVDDLWRLIFFDEKAQRMRTCIYTYVIDDSTWRFSETGTGFFTDYASKHALHANCSEYVRYAGQFHPRPKNGWNHRDGEWELVFDNWSGTYSPNQNLLDRLKALLQFNFPGLNIVTHHFTDPVLRHSMDELKLAEERFNRRSLSLSHLVLTPIIHPEIKEETNES